MLTFLEIEGRFFVEQLGAFGSQPFGQPKDANSETLWQHLGQVYPYSPQEFSATAGMEGPQTVLSWNAPQKKIARLMIRRKLREFPTSPADGILVLDQVQTDATAPTSFADCAANNLIRMLSEYLDIPEAQLQPPRGMFDIFDVDNDGVVDNNVVSDFYTKYESRYQVELDPYYKTTSVTLLDVIIEAQKKDLLQGPQTSDSNWWYYRVFVQPELVDIKDQFAGQGTQTMADIEFANNTQYLGTTFIDIQPYRNLTVVVENGSNQPLNFVLYTVPELPGTNRLNQAALIQSDYELEESRRNVPAGESVLISLADLSLKYISGLGTVENLALEGDLNDEAIKVHFIVNKKIHWQSNSYLSRPCLVYKTGRHQEVVWYQGHLPSVYVEEDERVGGPPKQALPHTNVSRLGKEERVNLHESQETQGPLYRFLKLFNLELDRTHHYLRALAEFNSDIFEAPREVLGHIAYELGWEVDLDRPLVEVRLEIMRLAGMYKAKGTTRLYEAISAQQTRVFPRVQEGPGMVARAANPDRF